ncbi:MAG: hypothetical protein WCR21_02685, partial [Bacteroidota bacterium]
MHRLMIITILICFQLQAHHQTYNLQKALNLHLVKASAKSLGGYQGYCIELSIENLGKDSLFILVEAGRRLIAGNNDEQDILVVKELLLPLRKYEKKALPIKGYCCQASKHAPSAQTPYALNHLADSDLVKVARHLNKNCFNSEIEQSAVWSISDKKPIANIPKLDDSSNLALRQLLANIKGEKLPWYNLYSSNYVSHYGQIIQIPQKLSGNLKYSNEENGYATLYVY